MYRSFPFPVPLNKRVTVLIVKNKRVTSVDSKVRERNKGPTARNCADCNLSGPSAQHKNKVAKQDRRRHIIAVGIGIAVPTAAVGTAYADGLAVGIDFLFIIMVELCLWPPSAQPMPMAKPSAQIFFLCADKDGETHAA
jgi:hypothetical protein